MANEIKDKYGTLTSLALTLASLASSTSGAGRQSTIVDNTTDRLQRILLFLKVKQGTSPTGNKAAYVYLLRDDNGAYRTDGAGASDAALTVQNATLIGVLRNKSSPSTGDVLYGDFVIEAPGPRWGIAIVH